MSHRNMFYFSRDHLVHGLHIEVPPPHHVRHSRIPLSIVQAPTPGDWMGTNLCKIEKCISFTLFATLEYKTQALTMWSVSWKSFQWSHVDLFLHEYMLDQHLFDSFPSWCHLEVKDPSFPMFGQVFTCLSLHSILATAS